MKNQNYVRDVTVTALNILDGIEHNDHWEILQPAWERAGYGFIEFCAWVAEIAEESERLLEERAPQNFPGVYDYEVSCTLGAQILRHVISTGCLPDEATWKHMLTVLADDFFSQGESK